MSTKVKGDKIKEGSIPLSALSSEVQGKINGYNLFVLPEDFIEEQYDEPDEDGFFGKVKQVYVTDILENRYNKINVDGVLGDINITDYFIIITTKQEAFQTEVKQESYFEITIRIQNCKFTNQAYINKSPFVTPLFSTDAADINGDIRYNFVKFVTDSELTIPELTIPEKNKQLFKKNMGSFANWNAQEGEAGYIENRTHYTKPYNKIVINDEDISTEYTLLDGLENNFAYQLEGHDRIFRAIAPETNKPIGNVEPNDWGHINSFGPGFNIICSQGKIYIKNNYGYIEYKNITFWNENISQLDEIFIPNTVLKTTPQTLSDEDKNQALANLGIDPVVLKYMCEPFKLENGVKIPQELHNIIWDNELSKLKPISCKLLITDSRIIDYIGSDYVEVSSISLRYDYNAADNTFVESV